MNAGLHTEQHREYADQLGKLANAKSRLKFALQTTWDICHIPKDVQSSLLELVLDGNKMQQFSHVLECAVPCHQKCGVK